MAKWIWASVGERKDQYVEFVSSFRSSNTKLEMMISVDTDYMVYINNKLIGFDQFICYPEHPVYDLLTFKCKKGMNTIKIIVHHYGGETFLTYAKGKAGLYFQIKDDKNTILESDEHILSSESLVYESGHAEIVTPQMGYRQFIDNSKIRKVPNYTPSVVVEKSTNFRIRDNLKIKLGGRQDCVVSKIGKGHYILDYKEETVGYLDVDFVSPKKQTILIRWGEHLVDGKVPERISNRVFETRFIAKKGRNKFLSTFRRYGLRYFEVITGEDININYFGVNKSLYPFKYKKWSIDNKLRSNIYKTALHTLECCYHEHFEDCPWREQAFYTMDSRNQMLYHMLVFKNKETFKSGLNLILECDRKDNILSLTFPNSWDFTIPSYSLYVFEQFLIYYRFTKDIGLLEKAHNKLFSILNAFIEKFDGKLISNFQGPQYWNYYEWVDGLSSHNAKNDALMNMMMVNALNNMIQIDKILGIENNYLDLVRKLKKNINKYYFNKEDGLYIFSKENSRYYKLVNAFAVTSKICTSNRAKEICEKLVNDNSLINTSLSMKCYLYDALLMTDKNKYKDYVLSDIDKTFKYQLDNGATSFWETENGGSDFGGAGSLCHAWSSIAIYYYNKLGVVKK